MTSVLERLPERLSQQSIRRWLSVSIALQTIALRRTPISTQDNLTIVQGIYAAFGQANIPSILNMLADDVEFHEPPGGAPPFKGTYHGRAGWHLLTGAGSRRGCARVRTARICRAAGHRYDTDWAMVGWFRSGKVVKFQIHDDSALPQAKSR